MKRQVTLLGIESSCDDTAAAVLQRDASGQVDILSSVVFDQGDLHANYGGVVPEIAARAHAERLDHTIASALSKAAKTMRDIDAICVTSGPGLIGGVVSGVMYAKGLAVACKLPLIGINHLAGHALTPRLTDDIAYPYLMLLVSGGHCQFLLVKGHDSFERLGGTIDDAPGEAFDKIARLIGLGQPGGPAIEKAALQGNPERFTFPRPLSDRATCDMSFSGLKTAVLRACDLVVSERGGITEADQADLAASFQQAVVDVLKQKTGIALKTLSKMGVKVEVCAVAGGVAANQPIRDALSELCKEHGVAIVAPPLALCTDNAAMIAYAGFARFDRQDFDDMTLSARPRWPLDQTSPAMLGSGRKGAKA